MDRFNFRHPVFHVYLILSLFLSAAPLLAQSDVFPNDGLTATPAVIKSPGNKITISWRDAYGGSWYLDSYELRGRGLIYKGKKSSYKDFFYEPSENGSITYRVSLCLKEDENPNHVYCGYHGTSRVKVTIALPPEKPGAFGQTSLSCSTSHTISWGAAVGGNRYDLEQRIDNGSWLSVGGATNLTSRSVTINNAVAGKRYQYRVRARHTSNGHTSNNSDWTYSENMYKPYCVPGKPGAINGSSSVNTPTFSLSWGAASGNVAGYYLRYRKGSSGAFTLVSPAKPAKDRSYTFDTQGVNDSYQFQVTAYNQDGREGPATDIKTVNVNIPLPAPGIPSEFTVPAEDEDGSFEVSWKASTGIVEHYVLEEYQSNYDGTWNRIGSGTVIYDNGSERYTYQALSKDVGIYRYQVKACNVDACSAPTNQLQIASHDLQGLRPEQVVVNASAVGNTAYRTAVNHEGSATIRVPVNALPGINGLAPTISVHYDSGRGRRLTEAELPEDILGYGWRLNGFSEIRRCARGPVGNAFVRLNNEDGLCLDGEPLILVGGSHLTPGAEYRTYHESYQHIVLKGTVDKPWFELKAPNGSVFQYGQTADSRVRVFTTKTRTAFFQWSVNHVRDAFNNEMAYHYHKDELKGINYPLRITYEGASVEFAYLARGDVRLIDFADIELGQLIQLHTIEIKRGDTLVRDYRFMNEEAPQGWRRLTFLQECGYDETGENASCLSPLAFDWIESGNPGADDFYTGVERITDSLGAITEFQHQYIVAGGANAMLFNEQPFGAPIAPTNAELLDGETGKPLRCVITALRRDNGLGSLHTTTFAYSDTGFNSTKGWGFLGFYTQRAIDQSSGVVTYTQHRLDVPFAGRVSALHQYDAEFGIHTQALTNTETNYSSQSIPHSNGNHTILAYDRQITRFRYEGETLLGAEVEIRDYSFSNGLITQIDTTLSTGTQVNIPPHTPSVWGDRPTYTLANILNTQTHTATLQHRTSNGQWLLGFNDSITSHSYDGIPSGSGVEQKTQTVKLAPKTGSLAVDTVTRFEGDAENELTTRFDYDDYGNQTGVTVEGAFVTARTTTQSDFLAHRYPRLITNALGHTTTINSYDLRFGTPKNLTDVNGLEAQVIRDAFGRVVARTDVNGVTTTIDYESCQLITCELVGSIIPAYRTVIRSPITPTRMQYYDRVDRIIRTEVQAFSANDAVIQDIYYDQLGRTDHYTLPYLRGKVFYAVTRDYDIRNRVILESRADGGSTDIDYDALGTQVRVKATETVLQADGAFSQTLAKANDFNILGQLKRVTDAMDSDQSVVVDYAYDPHGNMKTATVDGGDDGITTTSLTYDAAGNRTILVGPDVGTVVTHYNALGQVRTNTDNKQQTTTYTYDLLARLTERSNSDGTAEWVYDPVNAKGLLDYRSHTNGFRQTAIYDDPNRQARLSRLTTTLNIPDNNKTFHQDFTYDTYGRIEIVGFPSGFSVKNRYNAQGYIEAIVNNSNSEDLQTLNTTDAFGITQETYGNGAITQRQFDPKSGRLTTIDTTVSDKVIQDLSYRWRSDSVLESRISTLAGANREERFGYDPLRRLEQAKTFIGGNPQRVLDYAYSKLGNLTRKTSNVVSDLQADNYRYGTTANAGPHAVSEVAVSGINYQLHYDKNGAVTHYDAATGPDKFVVYNAANQPVSITVGETEDDPTPEGRDEFLYGPDGARYYKKSTYGDQQEQQRIEHTFYLGAYELTEFETPENDVKQVEKTMVGDSVMHIRTTSLLSVVEEHIEYLHRDHLGSIETITDEVGEPLLRLAFDPYGTRRSDSWQEDLPEEDRDKLLESLKVSTSRGFTGHEHLDRTGFIHMNGRVYDPQFGRFLSPDPIVQAPGHSQSWNRYSYVWNNPLNATDLSGFSKTIIDCDDCMGGSGELPPPSPNPPERATGSHIDRPSGWTWTSSFWAATGGIGANPGVQVVTFVIGGTRQIRPVRSFATTAEIPGSSVGADALDRSAGASPGAIREIGSAEKPTRMQCVVNEGGCSFILSSNVDARPWYMLSGKKWESLTNGLSQVSQNEANILAAVKATGVDPNLIRAVMHYESGAGGPKDLIVGPLGLDKTIQPMNIGRQWASAYGIPVSNLRNSTTNVLIGAKILDGIMANMTPNPTAAQVYTLYNNLNATNISWRGVEVQRIYDNQLWSR